MEDNKTSLYLVATPIGNLSDISSRALEVLSSVDFIAAEDTRNSGVLLSHFGIKKPMISYFQHNIRERGEIILERLRKGETCALISDAGMPAISDPGELIVRQCHEEGLKVSAVPGPCALVCALAMSGLSTARFSFEGFLSTSGGPRRDHLESLKNDTHTLVFYEAPHKLRTFLSDIRKYFGNRKISLVREISKIYEEAVLTTVDQAIAYYKDNEPRGEFVIVIEGASAVEEIPDEETIKVEFENLISQGKTKSEASKIIASKYNVPKREIYDMFK